MQWSPRPPNEAGRQVGRETDRERLDSAERDSRRPAARLPWWRRLLGRSENDPVDRHD
jgi:hypothetical protein